MAQKHIPNLPPVPRAAPLPAGLPYRLTERQLGLLLHQPRTAPRRQSTLACLRAIERENYLEQRAILVLFRLKLWGTMLPPQCPVSPQREERS